MAAELLATGSARSPQRPWELELDAEVPLGARAVTTERARALAELLARVPGLDVLAIQPHCDGRFVLARVRVDASDLSSAMDRATAFLRSGAMDAGIGPLILVAARCAGLRPSCLPTA